MNFLEAVEVAREKSVKIRRPHWITPSYLKYDESGGYIVNEADVNPALNAGDYLANDWKIKMKRVTLAELKPGDKFWFRDIEHVKLSGRTNDNKYLTSYVASTFIFVYFTDLADVEIYDV